MAEADGIVVTEVVELPPDSPTEAQLVYARNLNLAMPERISFEELSDLISLTTWKDKKASPDLVALATEYGAVANQYTGKKQLFDRIFHELRTSGREEELAGWFAYRVYREVGTGAPIASPRDERIKSIATQLVCDAAVMKSIRKYQGQDLV